MTTWQKIFNKLDEFKFELPKSFQPGMRAPGIIYTDEQMIEHIYSENAHLQVANVACLPGIVKASMAMPDVHHGYGMPIGGVAAFDPENGGIISPGMCGYDINCITGETGVLHEFGYKLKIRDFEKIWQKERIKCLKLNPGEPVDTEIVRFIKTKAPDTIYKIVTTSGIEITATEDHPFYTEKGMTPLCEVNSRIAIYPFEGVPYEEPSNEIIVAENDVKRFLLSIGKDSRGHGLEQTIIQLKKRNLLPLRYNSEALPYLIKIMGYVWGDGHLGFIGKQKKGVTSFYGKPEDLDKIAQDIEQSGFKPSKMYSRDRKHKIKTFYGEFKFERTEHSIKVGSTAFATLLAALGEPQGNKAAQDFVLPNWLLKAPLWQKRLFLAAFFGAELTSPNAFESRNYNFYTPILSINKKVKYMGSGELFLTQISQMLSDFSVKTSRISKRKSHVNKNGEVSYRLRLILSSLPESLLNLWGKVGFEYNKEKQFLANVLCHYIKLKENVKNHRTAIANKIKTLKKDSWLPQKIKEMLKDDPYINEKFIERSLWGGRKTKVRTAYKFPTLKKFIKDATHNLGNSGMVWDTIYSISEAKDDYVYDFTVSNDWHNFVANNFVVSNCGVRMLRTNLKKDKITSKIKDIVYALASNIACGVGRKGPTALSKPDLEKILKKGSKWAVENGYGWQEDIEHTEEQGSMQGANPECISRRAKERGLPQQGTLGSGNHFVEVQYVQEIYDEQAAQAMGIEKDTVTIMIHSGSRGLGHQVCTDYVKVMTEAARKYKILLPDRQLCCAPVNSEEGQEYFAAMACAANYAWCNRQMMMHWAREAFARIAGSSPEKLGMDLIYDVTHNIVKMEKHGGKTLCIHRKGATRAFPGQPVIVPGDMGRCSFLLLGSPKAMEETFGSVCHGAGRVMSRAQATKHFRADKLVQDLAGKGIVVHGASKRGLAEEAPEAYKDVRDVVNVVEGAGLAKKVAKLRPLGVIKG